MLVVDGVDDRSEVLSTFERVDMRLSAKGLLRANLLGHVPRFKVDCLWRLAPY